MEVASMCLGLLVDFVWSLAFSGWVLICNKRSILWKWNQLDDGFLQAVQLETKRSWIAVMKYIAEPGKF